MKDLSSLESYSYLNIRYQNRNFPELLSSTFSEEFGKITILIPNVQGAVTF